MMNTDLIKITEVDVQADMSGASRRAVGATSIQSAISKRDHEVRQLSITKLAACGALRS